MCFFFVVFVLLLSDATLGLDCAIHLKFCLFFFPDAAGTQFVYIMLIYFFRRYGRKQCYPSPRRTW